MLNQTYRFNRAIFAAGALLLVASAAQASVKMPATVSKSLQNLHPQAKILAANVDEDGLYQVEVGVKQERFLVELTRSGRVISNESQGKFQSLSKKNEDVPTRVIAAVKKLYPKGNVTSAKADGDGIFYVHVDTPVGTSTVEVTRSGRVLKHDRDASDQDEDFSFSPSLSARHIESVRKLPAAVLAAAESSHPGGVIVHVYHDHYGARYGRSEYYVTVVKGDQVYDLGLSATGHVLKNRLDNQTQRLARLPQVVRAAAQRTFPTGVIYGAGTRNNIHQVDILVDGLPYDLEISATGQLISKKRDYHE